VERVGGTVAGAPVPREWAQAGILTFAVLVTVAVIVFAYAVASEPAG